MGLVSAVGAGGNDYSSDRRSMSSGSPSWPRNHRVCRASRSKPLRASASGAGWSRHKRAFLDGRLADAFGPGILRARTT